MGRRSKNKHENTHRIDVDSSHVKQGNHGGSRESKKKGTPVKHSNHFSLNDSDDPQYVSTTFREDFDSETDETSDGIMDSKHVQIDSSKHVQKSHNSNSSHQNSSHQNSSHQNSSHQNSSHQNSSHQNSSHQNSSLSSSSHSSSRSSFHSNASHHSNHSNHSKQLGEKNHHEKNGDQDHPDYPDTNHTNQANHEHSDRKSSTVHRKRRVSAAQSKMTVSRSKSMPEIAAQARKRADLTFFQYILQELNMDIGTKRNDGWNDEALEALYRSPESIRNGVYNFLRVPLQLERFIFYAMIVCLDVFLYYLVLMPIRILFSFIKIILRRPLKISDICDIIRLFTILTAICILMPLFNYSFLYHYIRGQSTLKLYVTYNMLELFDKMSSAFGIDIQDAMYYSATKYYFDRGISFRERLRVAIDAILSILGYIVYLFIHTTLLYVRIITLNVALNSSNNALFTLLQSNNFLELKKPIFKRFAKENVFQFACHDAMERFQILLFGVIISLQNARAAVFTGNEVVHIFYCILFEVLVDFLKHGFIAKFNNIPSSVYSRFLDKLCEDMTEDRLQDTFLDNMNIASRRLGLTPIPLATITIYVFYLYLQPSIHDSWWRISFYVQIYLTLLLIKFVTNILVIGYASRRRTFIERRRKLVSLLEKDAPETAQPKPQKDSEDSSVFDLTRIYRYSLFGKRLPE